MVSLNPLLLASPKAEGNKEQLKSYCQGPSYVDSSPSDWAHRVSKFPQQLYLGLAV